MRAEDADGVMEKISVCPTCHRVRCSCPELQANDATEQPHGLPLSVHRCAADQVVQIVARTPRGWVTTQRDGLRFNAPERAVFVNPARQVVYCPHMHQTFELDPKIVVMNADDIMSVSDTYFSVLRERDDTYFSWVMSYIMQWAVYVCLQWRVGSFFTRLLLSRKWTRRVSLWFFLWAMPNQTRYVTRLLFLTLDGVVKKHPRFVKIASFCTAALITYWGVKKMTKRNARKADAGPVGAGSESTRRKKESECTWETHLGTLRPRGSFVSDIWT